MCLDLLYINPTRIFHAKSNIFYEETHYIAIKKTSCLPYKLMATYYISFYIILFVFAMWMRPLLWRSHDYVPGLQSSRRLLLVPVASYMTYVTCMKCMEYIIYCQLQSSFHSIRTYIYIYLNIYCIYVYPEGNTCIWIYISLHRCCFMHDGKEWTVVYYNVVNTTRYYIVHLLRLIYAE